MRDHISYSEWMCWRNCQQRWKFDYLDQKSILTKDPNLDFGTAIHSTLEKFRNNDVLKRPSLNESVDIFRKEFNNMYDCNLNDYLKNVNDKKKLVPKEEFLDAGEHIIRSIDDCKELRESKILFNEHKIMQPISRFDDLKINFKGFIDIVIKTLSARKQCILYICDFKTCSWGWNFEKKKDQDRHFQLLLYKHFFCKEFDLDPTKVRTAFILLKKKPKKNDSAIEWLTISAGPTSVQRALDELDHDITLIKKACDTSYFKRNLDVCINKYNDRCPYFDMCNGITK